MVLASDDDDDDRPLPVGVLGASSRARPEVDPDHPGGIVPSGCGVRWMDRHH